VELYGLEGEALYTAQMHMRQKMQQEDQQFAGQMQDVMTEGMMAAANECIIS